jgi:hypothetical protein
MWLALLTLFAVITYVHQQIEIRALKKRIEILERQGA